MRPRSLQGFVVSVVVVCLALALWAKAGDVNPPTGPIVPTMKTLDQLSSEHSQLVSAIAGIGGGGGGGVKQIVRGVISFPTGQFEIPQDLSSSINPAKSIAVVSDAVLVSPYTGTQQYVSARNGACLVNLTPTAVTIRIDDASPSGVRQVSYQIIEYY